MQVQRRSVAKVIVLSLITCGFYYLYLIYKISLEMNELSGTSKNSPSLELLLTLVTCGIYGFFWYYKMGSQCSILEEENGMRVNPIGVLCLVLAVFGLGIISIAILQNEINTIIEENYY